MPSYTEIDPKPLTALQTPYVFLDTSVLVRSNFNWDAPPFRALQRLCQAGVLTLLTSEIIRREISAQLQVKIEIAGTALNRARKAGSILLQLDRQRYQPAWEPLDNEAAHSALLGRADAFFASCRAVRLDVFAIDPQAVFEAYFAAEPPFSGGEKKAEFPDAFNLAAIRAWVAEVEENARVYIVTEDHDLLSACDVNDQLIGVRRLEEVVSLAQAEAHLLSMLTTYVREAGTSLTKYLKSAFPKLTFYLADQEGEVDEIALLDFTLNDVYLLNRDVQEGWFEVEVTGTVQFVATVTYGDATTAIWDPGDKVAVPRRKLTRDLAREEPITLNLQLNWRDEQFVFVDRDIAEPRLVAIVVERVDGE